MPKAEKAVAEKKWELDKVFQKCSEQWLQEGNKYADPEAVQEGQFSLRHVC